MKIAVLLKQVPATDSRVKIASPSAGVDTSEVKWELNPYDEYALEAGLRLKDEGKATEVITFTFGGKATEAKIRDGLARGADRAVRLDDPAFEGADSLGIARALAAAVLAEGCTLVLGGKQAVDTDNSQVPAMVAELLGWSQATDITQLEVSDGVKAWSNGGGGSRLILQMALPAVLTCDKGLNEPRYASLKGIMMAKKKAIAVKSAADLGISAGGVVVSYDGWSLPPDRPAGRILQGDSATRAKELVRLLREEAKVI